MTRPAPCILLATLIGLTSLPGCGKKHRATEPDPATPAAPTGPTTELLPLLRFFDVRHNEHVYTYGEGQPAEYRKNPGRFITEKTVGYVSIVPLADTVPLYRALANDERHYFTLGKRPTTPDIVRVEAFDIHVWTTKAPNRVPVHAAFMPDDKDAFFDTDLGQVRFLVEGTLKEHRVQRKVVESMFYVYSSQLSVPKTAPRADAGVK